MTDKVPEWVHMAEVPPPTDEEPLDRAVRDVRNYERLRADPDAPSGAAAAYAVLVVLALVAFVVWRMTRG